MKTIKIKFEGVEVEQKFVDYSVVLNILKSEDEGWMRVYRAYKDRDSKFADDCLVRAIEIDAIIRKLHKMFGGEFD